MKCRKCGKDIREDQFLCDECLYTNEVSDADLIQDEIEFVKEESNEDLIFEDTKELVDLSSLNENDDINNNDLDDDLDTREARFNKKRKINRIIIILSIFFTLVLILILFLVFKKPNKTEEQYEIDYEKVLNMYGKKLEKKVLSDSEIETLDDVEIEFDYDVICKVKVINEDRTIYLDNCKINDKKISYSFGEKKDKENIKKIEIYKNSDGYNNEEGELIAQIECEDETCEYVHAFDDYVILKEKGDYYLYQYHDKKRVNGPFNSNYITFDNYNKLYGIYYVKNNIGYLYSSEKNKEFKDIKGNVFSNTNNLKSETFYKYGYIIFDNDGYDFVSLKTGKVSYSIKDNVLRVEEDMSNNVAYILTYTLSNTNFKIINTHGKELFDGESFNYFKLGNSEITVANSKQFKKYDLKLNLILSSNKYDTIFTIDDTYALVLDKSKIKLVDLDDNLLTSFDISDIDGEVDMSRTGWGTINGKKCMIIYFKGTKTFLYYDQEKGELIKNED